jgi:hypothetical protein
MSGYHTNYKIILVTYVTSIGRGEIEGRATWGIKLFYIIIMHKLV